MRITVALVAVIAALSFLSCTTPDAVIRAKVKAKLIADEAVRPYTIEVETREGEVTVTGNVDSQEAKDQALLLAKDTNGVTNVVDMITVRTAETLGDAPEPDRTIGEHIDDAGITARVKSRLLEDPLVKGLNIDVDTRAGVVFLTGSVRNETEKETAIQVARSTQGVKGVQANLSVSTS
ncbi:MAG TPA: BON domain-containing protein [Candidatus Polarisedimenticolia bacterium]|jgi:hyperosmotically inducible protein